MADDRLPVPHPDAAGRTHSAAVRARIGGASLDATVSVSTAGLLAIGGLVSGILLSTAVLVLAATRTPARRWPR